MSMIRQTFVSVIIILSLAGIAVSQSGKAAKRTKHATPKASSAQVAAVVVSPVVILYGIAVEQWQGVKFYLLEKGRMFAKYGYELYTSPSLGDDRTPARIPISNVTHRIKTEVFQGHTLTVKEVTALKDGEYLVEFSADTLGLKLYGKPRKGIIEGMAPLDDLARAKARWVGKTVYSRRRNVQATDSLRTAITARDVAITEPLTVVDVRWGLTPIPVKPLWVIVRQADGQEGFIPVNFSWTNVIMEERKVTDIPWNDDLLEQDPKKTFGWDPYVWEIIEKHSIFMGMTAGQVVLSWGEPTRKAFSANKNDSTTVSWIYRANTLVFRNDTLVKEIR